VSAKEATSTDPRTNALLRIVSAIEIATTLDELLLLTLSEFADLLDVTYGAVIMLDEEREHSRIISTYPPRVNMPPAVPLYETPYLKQAIETRQPIQVYDVRAVTNTSSFMHYLHENSVVSALIVPLFAQDRVTALLALGTTTTQHDFSENSISLARILAGQLAAAITAFVLTEAAQRRSAELTTLNDISFAVTSSLNTQEIYHLVVQKLNEYFRVEAGSLLMRDEQTGDLEFVMTLEAGVEKLAGVIVPRGEGVVGYVAEKQRYAIVPEPQQDPRFYSKISENMGYTTRSILCVPMIVKGRTIGVIELLNKRDGDFTEEDADRMMRMAATIGVAIENARLFQQVANGRDRLEAVLNSNKDGILMAETNGVVMIVNPRAAQFLQQSQEELLGRQISDLLNTLHSRAVDILSPSWLHESAGTSDMVELELQNPYGFIRQISLPVRDAIGMVIGQLTLLQDISGERELAQLRDDYTGMLVHDLRAPLTAIMNGIMMVRRGLGGPVSTQQDELLSIAYQSSQSMLEMVNTLLDISKMEQGRMDLHIEPFSPYTVIDETFDRLRASAANHDVVLVAQIPDNLPLLEADREKVVRILQNLIDNAIKFSPHGGEITLGAAYISPTHTVGASTFDVTSSVALPVQLPELDQSEWLLFWISDQGPGIPPQYQDRIFEKFGQIRGRKVRGTGLGLTFCKLATESHGGKIWLESVEGEGTTFVLTLPVKQGY
jgi:PAS domain S-box-containing protein